MIMVRTILVVCHFEVSLFSVFFSHIKAKVTIPLVVFGDPFMVLFCDFMNFQLIIYCKTLFY